MSFPAITLIVQIFEIIGCVYQYLKLLRQVSPQEWIFKELQDIGNMEFTFSEEQPQDDYAAELAGLFCLFVSSLESKSFYMFLMLSYQTAFLFCNINEEFYSCTLSVQKLQKVGTVTRQS